MDRPMTPKRIAKLLAAVRSDEALEIGERMLAKQLTAEEEAELREAKTPEAQPIYELFRPLDEPWKKRVRDSWLKSLREPAAEDRAEPQPARGLEAVPLRKKRITGPLLFGALALAASFALWYSQRPTDRLEYTMELLAPAAAPHDSQGRTLLSTGGTQREVESIEPGQCLTLNLRPRTAKAQAVQAQAFWSSGETLLAWPIEFEKAATGALTNSGDCARVPSLAQGRWQLLIVIGQSIPKEAGALQHALQNHAASPGVPWTVLGRSLQVKPKS